MAIILNDIKYAFRQLIKSPGFTAVAVLTLAFGIGANTAIFSVANSVLLRPLPYKDSDRLVMLWSTRIQEGRRGQPSPLDFVTWRRESSSFESMGAIRPQSLILTGHGEPVKLRAGRISLDFFQTLGLVPCLGRAFDAKEYLPGAGRVAMLSHGLWRNRFGSDPETIGRSVRLGDESFTVVGILPDIRQYPVDDTAVWIPLELNESQPDERHFLFVVGRLTDDKNITEAQADINTIATKLEQQFPQSHTGYRVNIIPFRDSFIGPMRPVLTVLFGAVGFVLLIACSNVANLLLARASARSKEISIRVALGASRWRLTRQMLAESCMLALAGGILGVVFASVGVYLLLANIPAELPLPSFIKNIGLDWRVLGFTVLLSMVTGIIFGIFPALRASGVSPNSVLKEGERTNTVGYGQSRLRSTLIVAELALTMILLVAAGLLMKNVIQLQRTEPGLNSDNVLVMNISLPAAKYGQSDQKIAFYRETLERVRMLPGVNYAGVINNLPFRGWTGFNFTIEGRPALLPGQVPEANERVVSCGYFQAMGIPLLKGREFTDREGPDAEPVVMVNHAMVQRYFPNEDPIGRRIRPGGSDSSAPWYTIVGIVGDVLHFGLDKRPQAEIYKLNTQDPWLGMTLVVRTKSEPLGMASAVKQQIWSVDPEQPISGISDMTHVLSDSLWQARILTYIQGVFGVVALLMAAVGLYGVVSQSVTSRMHEFGVRVALGAERIDIFKLVLRQGLKLVFVGSVIGLIGAIVLTKSLTVVLRNISPTDPVVYIAITVFLAAVTLLACYIPARRAAKTDPMEALRYE